MANAQLDWPDMAYRYGSASQYRIIIDVTNYTTDVFITSPLFAAPPASFACRILGCQVLPAACPARPLGKRGLRGFVGGRCICGLARCDLQAWAPPVNIRFMIDITNYTTDVFISSPFFRRSACQPALPVGPRHAICCQLPAPHGLQARATRVGSWPMQWTGLVWPIGTGSTSQDL